SPQDVTHAASLLAYLNHQRDRGIFCDCVLRQGQNSDQLYHAHRCILAASSPVLASILSSSGVLVELHDPSLPDSVLPSLLDYIYTGVLPHPLSKQEYYRLLSAACQMQMKELQDALRVSLKVLTQTTQVTTVKPDMRQRTPEEDLLSKSKERKRCSSSPSSSSPPCSEAVPVICHSSRAAVLHQSKVSVWPHNQASESFVQPPSKIAHFSLSLVDKDYNSNNGHLFKFNDTCKNASMHFSATACGKVLESRKNSSPETAEPCSFLTAPIDHKLSGATRRTAQPNHWHLPHQGKRCDDASLQDSNHQPLKPALSPDSDELGGEVNAPFSAKRSLSQYFFTEIEDQSDMNTKHDELPVPCQHGHDKEVKQFVGMDTADAQANQDSSVARAETLDEADGQRDIQQGNPFDIKPSQTEDCITLNISMTEVPKPKELETQSSSSPVYSPLSEPDCDRASKPSTVSVCIPSTLPASMPTDRSAHLSSPNHQPFQCSLCDRSFSQRGSLNRHVRSHLGVRPFPCPCCPMTFSRQYRVTEHMRVHQRSALG
uniref:Uncharacterized protein n=1 Tax=Poecilia formosa TaxID=48698 RepID=A0A096LQG2_POEFO